MREPRRWAGYEKRMAGQFVDFRLDPNDAQLWRRGQVVKIKPKAFDVLRYLIELPRGERLLDLAQ
jgi:DNA-binding winged helix-turn-helix (wHTH) protein